MRKILSLLAVLAFIYMSASAQNRTVTGKVTDDSGTPIPFASIIIKGSKTGTTSDDNGAFTVSVARGQVLVISAAGMKDFEYPVADETTLTIKVQGRAAMQEVVVTALGIRREKKALGYS